MLSSGESVELTASIVIFLGDSLIRSSEHRRLRVVRYDTQSPRFHTHDIIPTRVDCKYNRIKNKYYS